MPPAMTRRPSRLALALALLGASALAGCDDEPDLPEDPPLAVPGRTVPDPPAPPPGMPPGMAVMPAEPASFDPPLAVPGHDPVPDPPAPPMPPAGMQPVGQPIPLAPGFQPDPIVQQGIAGGPLEARQTVPPSFAANCPGYIGPQPNHVIQLTAPFARLRIVVSSQTDTVLVVRGPNGEVWCHDDVNVDTNRNPLVEGAFGPGAYSVFVGTYDQGASGPYVIGFTELPQVSAQTLAAQAPPPGQPPPGQPPQNQQMMMPQ